MGTQLTRGYKSGRLKHGWLQEVRALWLCTVYSYAKRRDHFEDSFQSHIHEAERVNAFLIEEDAGSHGT